MSSIFTVPELAIGVGLSEAASAAFEPKVEVPKQSAWLANPQRVPDLGLIAELIAGGKVAMVDGKNMANRLGFSNGTMESLVWLTQNRLDFAVMLRMWRLGAVNSSFDEATLSDLLDKTLAHERLDWDYRPFLRALKTAELVGLGDIATGVVRSALPAPSYVPVPAPTSGLTVKRFPQVNIDPEQLAAALGFDKDMLQLMVARSGLSLAPGLAATALFRQLINDNDFLLAIAEGDLRTEWAETLKNASRQIPTVGESVEYQLRGFTDRAGRLALTDLHGMSHPHSDVVYDVVGRAPAVHAVTTGLARGGNYDGKPQTIPEPYLSAVQRANIRPEWYDIEYANRYTYPSAFVMRALAQAGDLGGQAAVEQDLLELGWRPSFATKVSTAWTTSAAAGDPHVTKAHSKAWTEAQSSYIAQEATAADVQPIFTLLGVPATAQTEVIKSWDEIRALRRKQLSPAQIKKAWFEQVVNPATNAPWTQAQAIAALEARGYDQADATTLLEL